MKARVSLISELSSSPFLENFIKIQFKLRPFVPTIKALLLSFTSGGGISSDTPPLLPASGHSSGRFRLDLTIVSKAEQTLTSPSSKLGEVREGNYGKGHKY